MIISGWLVRQCDRVSERHPLGAIIPKKHKASAFLFGFARVWEVIIIFWIPDNVLRQEYLNPEILLFILVTKLVAYSNYLYWTYQLSERCPGITD